MKHPFLYICLCSSLAVLATLTAEEPAIVLASSPEWAEIYSPPVKEPTEIPAGSKLRGELFELLRVKTGQDIQFAGSLKAFRNWACFLGRTVDRSGKSLKHPPLYNDDAAGLWLRTQDGWTVVAHSFGHSDAYFIIWPEQYGMPRELLGLEKAATPGKD